MSPASSGDKTDGEAKKEKKLRSSARTANIGVMLQLWLQYMMKETSGIRKYKVKNEDTALYAYLDFK